MTDPGLRGMVLQSKNFHTGFFPELSLDRVLVGFARLDEPCQEYGAYLVAYYGQSAYISATKPMRSLLGIRVMCMSRPLSRQYESLYPLVICFVICSRITHRTLEPIQ